MEITDNERHPVFIPGSQVAYNTEPAASRFLAYTCVTDAHLFLVRQFVQNINNHNTFQTLSNTLFLFFSLKLL